jgi:hypothetical protein
VTPEALAYERSWGRSTAFRLDCPWARAACTTIVTHEASSKSITITPPALDPSGETAAPIKPANIAAAHDENVTITAHRAQPLRSPTPDATPQSPTAATTSPGTAAEARLEQRPGWSMLSQYPLFRSAVTINGNRAAIVRPKSVTTEDHTTASPPATLADSSCGEPAAAPMPGADPTLIGRTICVVPVRVGSARLVVLL